tara:strand:- start:2113 stop:2514 length:402 start_codon:yes stop_codon:yes gene_type:complete
MASILKVDDLRGNTAAGDITITSEGGSATMQLQQGVAKAWFHYDGSGTTFADSFNGASATDDGTGTYTMTFTSSMSNANYAVTVSDDDGGTTRGFTHAKTYATGSFATRSSRGDNGSNVDKTTVATSVHGDLA